ncbi:lipoprotein [Acrocarpospora corrugata]|uniref:Lipoprotein n=1 Tax=Acrocarpospora corrugata TaxID=35763 RepID=A0A5M3W6E8_9ACTN|nr:hypothetical protein [Acrocarpospora corrugata]GES03879.1 lipoprotein [Acrocarpospora corrugata]
MTSTRQIALALSAIALLSTVACSGSEPGGETATGTGETVLGPPPTVEQLSAKVGCTPDIQVDAEDLRTGACKTDVGQFFVNTFATQKLKDEWMDQAPEYNPHLVGNLWTVLAERPVLDALKVKLGGDLHLSDHRVKSAAPADPAADPAADTGADAGGY